MLTKKLIKLNMSILKNEKISVGIAIDSCKTGPRAHTEDTLKHLNKLNDKLNGINKLLEYYANELENKTHISLDL